MKRRPVPPEYLNLFLVLSLGLHYLAPVKQIISPPYTYIGFVVVLVGIALDIWSLRQLRKNNTTTNFQETPRKLVVDGPFRFSRNPIYLSGAISLLGIALALGSVAQFVFPVALLLILDKYHIPLEEAALEETFGEDYVKYKRQVRRWL